MARPSATPRKRRLVQGLDPRTLQTATFDLDGIPAFGVIVPGNGIPGVTSSPVTPGIGGDGAMSTAAVGALADAASALGASGLGIIEPGSGLPRVGHPTTWASMVLGAADGNAVPATGVVGVGSLARRSARIGASIAAEGPQRASATAAEELQHHREPRDLTPNVAVNVLSLLCCGLHKRDGRWLRAVTRATLGAAETEATREECEAILDREVARMQYSRPSPPADPGDAMDNDDTPRTDWDDPVDNDPWNTVDFDPDDARVPQGDAAVGIHTPCDTSRARLALERLIDQAGGNASDGPVYVHTDFSSDNGGLEELVTFNYRQTSFTVPKHWLLCYLDDWAQQQASADPEAAFGRVSSVEHTLSILWPTLKAAADATGASDRGDYEDLLGCYNLPGAGFAADLVENYYFWSGGLGSPLKTHGLICRMVHAYSALIAEPFTSDQYCDDDFADFTRDLLQGRTAGNYDTSCSCKIRLHYVDLYEPGYTYGGLGTSRTFDRTCCGRELELPCDEGFRVNGQQLLTTSWESLAPTWEPLQSNDSRGFFDHGFWPSGRPDYDPFDNWPEREAAEGTTLGNALKARYDIQFHGMGLAYAAFLADWILFVSRIALDYSYEIGLAGSYHDHSGGDYRSAAVHISRYALCVASERGARLIHEIGHAWLGSHHCPYQCCFEIAALSWRCKVAGRLGLAMGSFFTPPGTSELDEDSEFVTSLPCGDCTEESLGYGLTEEISFPYEYGCYLWSQTEVGGLTTVCVTQEKVTTISGFGLTGVPTSEPTDQPQTCEYDWGSGAEDRT